MQMQPPASFPASHAGLSTRSRRACCTLCSIDVIPDGLIRDQEGVATRALPAQKFWIDGWDRAWRVFIHRVDKKLFFSAGELLLLAARERIVLCYCRLHVLYVCFEPGDLAFQLVEVMLGRFHTLGLMDTGNVGSVRIIPPIVAHSPVLVVLVVL
jgi:hypothetical protein